MYTLSYRAPVARCTGELLVATGSEIILPQTQVTGENRLFKGRWVPENGVPGDTNAAEVVSIRLCAWSSEMRRAFATFLAVVQGTAVKGELLHV